MSGNARTSMSTHPIASATYSRAQSRSLSSTNTAGVARTIATVGQLPCGNIAPFCPHFGAFRGFDRVSPDDELGEVVGNAENRHRRHHQLRNQLQQCNNYSPLPWLVSQRKGEKKNLFCGTVRVPVLSQRRCAVERCLLSCFHSNLPLSLSSRTSQECTRVG